jgi:HK97 family phage portal protein
MLFRTIARWLGYAPLSEMRPEGRTSLENPAVSLSDPQAWQDLGWSQTSDAGEPVTSSTMLTVPPVWQAVGMISGDVSRLPLEVYSRSGDDRDTDPKHPSWQLITPYAWANPEASALSLWRRLLVHALIWPRGYCWIERDGGGRPTGLFNLLPDRTSLERKRGKLWVITEVDNRLWAVDPLDVLIVENISVDECTAFGPLQAARHNIGLQLAKRKFTSRFYGASCHAGGILQVPPGASDKAVRKVEESMTKHRSGASEAFRALVLRDGFKWHQTTVSPDDAQASETEEQEVRNVARFYRMAPSRLGVKESVSYNSEEAARRAYYDETLSYWLAAIKSECNLKLLTEAERTGRTRFIDYNIAAWLWADTQTVISVGVQGVQWGIFNRNEVRRWFNMNSIPDGEGEIFWQPANMQEAGAEPEPQPAPLIPDPGNDPPSPGSEGSEPPDENQDDEANR